MIDMKTKTIEKSGKQSRIELVEDYFGTHADYWSNAYLKPDNVGDLVLLDRKTIAMDFLLAHLKPDAVVLDAGCGAGLATLDLLQKGFVVRAYDVSEKMLNLCQATLDSAKIPEELYSLHCGDLFAADLQDHSFDAIVALGFLQYQADEGKALRALNRLLKPGGILVVSGPVKVRLTEYFGLSAIYYKLRDLVKKTEPHPELAVLNAISTHYYSVGRYKKLLSNSDFKLIEYKGHGFINFAIFRDWTSRGQHLIYRLFKRLSGFLPIGRFGNDMVVLAQKRDEA